MSSKLQFSDPSERQVQQLCKDFLRMQKGRSFDPITASRKMREYWGINLDWHEFIETFEYLVNSREAEIIPSRSELTTYWIK